jgi:ERF superfamily
VRKTLGKYELAVIQTTHVDRESALVLLITTVAHGSGEWVSASWPVCRIADIANPKLMGAALTYARRYGLFTVVGLAGEDDLDAPPGFAGDQPSSSPVESVRSETPDYLIGHPVEEQDVRQRALQLDSADSRAARCLPLKPNGGGVRSTRRDASTPRDERTSAADPQNSIRELAAIEDPEALFRWARAILPLRNRLSDEARGTLDAAFLKRAQEINADPELLIAFAPASSPGSGPARLSALT